jgi:nitroreductase
MKQVETTREAMINRRSVRKYKTDMIPRDIIERIVEAGTYAANGRGHQASIILAVTNKELRDKLSEMNRKIGGWDEGFDPFYGAPVVLVVLAEKDWPTHVYDGSLVMGNLMLAAHTEGIGSCWIHRAKEEAPRLNPNNTSTFLVTMYTRLTPSAPSPATHIPITAPPENAMERALFIPLSLAALAVLTFALVATVIPQ